MSGRSTRTGGAKNENGFDERLLAAAGAVIHVAGYEGLNREAVAVRAGMPADEVPEPWELFAAVIRQDEDSFNGIVDKAVGATSVPAEQMLAVIEACVSDFDWTYWIELWSLALRDERARALREQLDSAFRTRIRKLIADGCGSGDFDVPDPDSTAVAIATLIDSLAVDATLGDDTVSPNYMFGASASVAGKLLGVELKLRSRLDDGA
jgi:BetI-type transcriptional repressor, C-terminal